MLSHLGPIHVEVIITGMSVTQDNQALRKPLINIPSNFCYIDFS